MPGVCLCHKEIDRFPSSSTAPKSEILGSNIDKTLADEFYQTQDWVECEMYSPKTNVEWGKTVVSEKEFPRRYYVLDMDKLQSF